MPVVNVATNTGTFCSYDSGLKHLSGVSANQKAKKETLGFYVDLVDAVQVVQSSNKHTVLLHKIPKFAVLDANLYTFIIN